MLQQTNKPSLQSPLKTFCVLFVHLLLTQSWKGHSQLIGPLQPIVATVGDDIILPCHLEPAMDVAAETLEWTRSDLNSTYVHVWRAHQDLIDTIHLSYQGRTSLFPDELKQGNISLKLSKVKLSDEGKYKCYIPKLNKQSSVELFVSAASSPVISIAGVDRDRGGVVLQCESKGWYPQPEVFWLDSEGNLLSAEPTETVRGPDDLYTVSSRVTVEKRQSNNFTCRVQQSNTNQIRETHIIVPDNFFKVQSSSFPIIIGLAVCIVLIGALVFFVWKWTKNKTKGNNVDETEIFAQVENKQVECDLLNQLQQLHEEKQRMMVDLQTLKEKLDTTKKELETTRPQYSKIAVFFSKGKKQRMDEGEKKEQTLKKQLETLENQLQSKEEEIDKITKQIEEKKDEVQQLRAEEGGN